MSNRVPNSAPVPSRATASRAAASSPVLVSACLLGATCRYDGRSKPVELGLSGPVVPVCPEIMAGFSVPRPAIERGEDGRVRVLETGEDVTEVLERASDRIIALARLKGATRAILKERSPSCGTQQLRRGGLVVAGEGIVAQRLRESGIQVGSELS